MGKIYYKWLSVVFLLLSHPHLKNMRTGKERNMVSKIKKNKKKQPKRMKLYLQTPLNYRTSKILAFSLSLFSLLFLYISENTRNTQMISTYRLKMFKIISKKYIGFVVKCAVRMQCSCVQLVNYPTTVQFLVE